MAAGDSIISIMNAACVALGEDLIASPDQQTKRAIIMNNRFQPVRKAVLRAFPYNSAKQQIQLALSTYVPAVTYDYAYSLPADCLRFWDLPDNDGAEWEVAQDATAGNLLFTNESPPLAGVYIRDLTDPVRMDALLVEVLGLELAMDTCEAITQSTSKLQAISGRLDKIRPVAQVAASDEASVKEWDDDVWLRSRR